MLSLILSHILSEMVSITGYKRKLSPHNNQSVCENSKKQIGEQENVIIQYSTLKLNLPYTGSLHASKVRLFHQKVSNSVLPTSDQSK